MTLFSYITLFAALLAAILMIVYWVKRPALSVVWRIVLFVAMAVLPTIAAGSSTVDGLEATTQREFCGSCHVMDAHYDDAVDASSDSLAARHTRNEMFGNQSCYKCHANYGMNGYVLTKMDGMKHVWHYYFGEYGSLTLDEAVEKIHINKPFPNSTCLQCHAGAGTLWRKVPEHISLEEEIRQEQVSCASDGCHNSAHPFSKAVHAGKPPLSDAEKRPGAAR